MFRAQMSRYTYLRLLALLTLGASPLACAGDATDEAGDLPPFQDAELAFPGELGVVRTGTFATPSGPRELTYHDIQGVPVFEGDIILTPLERATTSEGEWPGAAPQATVRAKGTRRWDNGIVPYTIDAGLTNTTRVTDAIAHWEANTPIQFVARTTETDYVTFITGSGCSSSIGQIGGQQFVNLATGCSTGNTIHEIGHTLGLWHEQSRTDRDNHILIDWSNIQVGAEDNFYTYVEKGSDGKNSGPYDIDSIMHYGSYSFPIDPSLPTITELDGSIIVANRTAVTDTDICAINRFYGFGKGSDFNNDGYADLVVGVPYEDLSGGTDQGAVVVMYGSSSGLTDTDALIHRDQPGVEEVASTGDRFGYAVAFGDFNGDCFADLAVGVPYDDVGGVSDAGSVQVFYGSVLGVNTVADEVWTQDEIGGDIEASDLFGYTLEVGDFDGDGYDDLVMGAPYEDIGAITNPGIVNVVYGAAGGLDATRYQTWNQNTGTIQDVCSSDEQFGRALATGDFDDDGFADLAVGVPYQDVSAATSAGAVHVIYGTIDGLSDAGNQLWTEANGGIPGTEETDDNFGYALAAGDFDSDGFADLAIGVPYQDVSAATDAGKITVMYGTGTGLNTSGSETWTQDSTGINGTAESYDRFGRSLVCADFDMDGYDDVAIGVPYEDVNSNSDAGAVNLILGSSGGLTDTNNELWTQDSTNIEDTAEASDYFGYTLAASDYDGDGRPDLAVGVPYEDLGGVTNMGAVSVIFGATTGLTSTGDELWSQDSTGIQDTGETSDLFGLGL